jgi:hypothetical protein
LSVRTKFDTELWVNGLFTQDSTEDIPEGGLVEVDGFIIDKGLLRKDWALVAYTEQVISNINYYVDVSLPVCDTGERGNPTPWPADPPVIPVNPDDRATLAWFSYFSGVSEIVDYTTEGNKTFSAEAWKSQGAVTFVVEEYNG